MNVDVVVCTKNQANSLNRVLQQIVREIPFQKLIIVYGSSADETKEIAEKYTDNVFWDGDKGLGAARNLGMRKATSEIVAMIDSDVILTNGWYRRLIRYFRDPKVAAVMGTCIYGYGCKPLELYWEYLRWNDNENWGCHNTMFRRSVVLEVGNFDEKITGAGEDYELYLRLLKAGYKWVWVKDATVYHPMNMLEYLNHVRWWARGRPFIHKLIQEAATKSLVRVYCSLGLLTLKSFRKGLELSVKVHPIMLGYFPLIRIITTIAVIKELKKNAKTLERLNGMTSTNAG